MNATQPLGEGDSINISTWSLPATRYLSFAPCPLPTCWQASLLTRYAMIECRVFGLLSVIFAGRLHVPVNRTGAE
jgi:hypothetical protein